MTPITKIWHCCLRDGKSAEDPSFLQLLSEVLEHCSSYTNPDPESPHMHIMYQDVNDPTQLLMITGYQTQDLNVEADKRYAEKYLPNMSEYVQHVWLKQLDCDISSLSLTESITVTYGPKPEEWKSEKGGGSWDVWPLTEQARKIFNGAGMLGEQPDEQVWVHVRSRAENDKDSKAPSSGGIFHLKRILGR